MYKIISVFSALFFLITAPAQAVEYLSPRTQALGGAGRAAPTLNDGIYLNPSYASFLPTYNISGGYTWFDYGRSYNVAIQDSRTELFQAGVGFTKREQNSVINIGASKQAIENLGFGLGAKILMDNNSNKMTTDTIFSSTFIVSPNMSAAFVVDNIFQTQSALERHLYRTFYLAGRIRTVEVIQLYLDPFYSPSYMSGKKLGVSAGAEIGLMADFFLRVGKFENAEVPYLDTRGSGYGLGAAWVGPKLSLDYSYHHVSKNDRVAGTVKAHSASMTIFF